MVSVSLPPLPESLSALRDLALDLRWTWSHETDLLWDHLDHHLWEQTRSPWTVLRYVSANRLKRLAADGGFLAELDRLAKLRLEYLENPGWFRNTHKPSELRGVAYFSMEFGLGTALPLYAGGLGVLAGDYLKTASDLDVPIIGIGLLYQEGYFRQMIDAGGNQLEVYPYNEPATMPIEPVVAADEGWLTIPLELPGRTLQLRIWQAHVGRTTFYLLDSNDPLNSPADRGITGKLYGGGSEVRLMQELVLGVGGWRVIETLRGDIEICHINEGHAAFALVERARNLAVRENLTFWEALWATRAGNIFTTHTPVAAGFDRFDASLVYKYLPYLGGGLMDRGVKKADILGLGRADPLDEREPFNMAFLAQRGSALTLGVSRLHGNFSRQVFQPIFARWPEKDVPIGHITNGVHVPTWDSIEADRLWTEACGKERWRAPADTLSDSIAGVSDNDLWAMRGEARRHLVQFVREHLATQLRERELENSLVQQAETVLDANVLTLGFARRFTEYKRPNILLFDLERLSRLLLDVRHPVQLVVAGKAHPADIAGKAMIQQWIQFDQQPRYRRRAVFLEDYDIALAQELVQGVDVWINTPRRPWEACGTSGMKVLVNGGLNLSIRDGWWDEAYAGDVGWAIDGSQIAGPDEIDTRDARSLYEILERQVVPEFYDRDASGLPRAWLARIRASMLRLTPSFSTTRMMQDYLERAYLPQAQAFLARTADHCAKAKELNDWRNHLKRHWHALHLGNTTVAEDAEVTRLSVPVFLGDISPSLVRVELYADPAEDQEAEVIVMNKGESIPGAANGHIYWTTVPSGRPAEHYTVRIVPQHPDAFVPAEVQFILWQR